MEYLHKIESIEVKPTVGSKSDVVAIAHWAVVGVEDGRHVRQFGSVALDEYVEGEPFTKFEDLTEEQVFEWVASKIDVPVIEERLVSQMEEIKNPPLAYKGLPWVEAPSVTPES